MSSDEKKQKRVVIIGAGASGIGAARTLSSAGINVVILEGRDRIGGRMKKHCLTKNLVSSSWMEAEHSVSIQLGANWIHGMEATTNPMFEVAQKLGLELHQTSSDDDPGDDVILFDSGMNTSTTIINSEKTDQIAYSRVSKEDYHETLSRYEWIKEYVDRISVNYEKEDISLQAAFDLALKASESEIFGPCPPAQLRCLTWLYDRVSIDLGALSSKVSLNCYAEGVSDGAGGEGLVKHVGYAHILHHLAEEFPLDIRLNHQVAQVSVCTTNSTGSSTKQYDFAGITVLSADDMSNPLLQSQLQSCVLKDGRCVRIDCTNGETFIADACIITVPVGVLQSESISFVPRPPSVITSVCSSLKLGLMNLVWLWFPEVFWPEECNFLGVARDGQQQVHTAVTQEEKQEQLCGQTEADIVKFTTFLIPPMFDNYGVRQPVLMCQIVGPYATTIESMSDAEIAAAATVTLRAMFGADKVPDPIGCAHSQWGSDPFSRGSWSYFPYRADNSSFVSGAISDPNGETVGRGAGYPDSAIDDIFTSTTTIHQENVSSVDTGLPSTAISTTTTTTLSFAEDVPAISMEVLDMPYPLQRSVSIAEAASAVRSAGTTSSSTRRYVEFSDIGCTSDGSDETSSSSSSSSDDEYESDEETDFGASDLTSLAGMLSDYSSSEGRGGVRTITLSTNTTTTDTHTTTSSTTTCIYRNEDEVISAHLYYASEAMSVLNRGTVHGAYMSGIREANRILSFLDEREKIK